MTARFGWASLQIRQISCCSTSAAVREALGTLPDELKSKYDLIMDKIASTSDLHLNLAHRAFKLVLSALKPLSVDMLLEAICIEPIDSIDLGHITAEDVLEACRGLLILEEETSVCAFCHPSVSKYLLDRLWSQQDCHTFAAKTCVLALLQDRYVDYLMKDPVNRYTIAATNAATYSKETRHKGKKLVLNKESTFRAYAVSNWIIHLVECGEVGAESGLSNDIDKFLGKPLLSSYYCIQWALDLCGIGRANEVELSTIWGVRPEHEGSLDHFFDLLDLLRTTSQTRKLEPTHWRSMAAAVICTFPRLAQLCQHHWNTPWEQPARLNLRYGWLLPWACRRGNFEACKLLVDWGCKTQPKENHLRSDFTPLFQAIFSGDAEIVELVLRSGTKINPHDETLWKELGNSQGDAVFCQNLVRTLIERAKDRPIDLYEAFRTTIKKGDMNGFEQLLRQGSNANVLSRSGDSPLLVAIRSKALQFTESLLSHGADVNYRPNQRASGPLVVAVTGSNKPLVKQLLAAGADPNLNIIYYKKVDQQIKELKVLNSALHIACTGLMNFIYGDGERRHEQDNEFQDELDVMQMLLEAGANPNVSIYDENWGSIMARVAGQCCSVSGHCKHDAANLPSEHDSRSARSVQIAEVLVRYGAKIDAEIEFGKFETVVDAAYARPGNQRMIEWLEKNGATRYVKQGNELAETKRPRSPQESPLDYETIIQYAADLGFIPSGAELEYDPSMS
jgi:hypothetical protein